MLVIAESVESTESVMIQHANAWFPAFPCHSVVTFRCTVDVEHEKGIAGEMTMAEWKEYGGNQE